MTTNLEILVTCDPGLEQVAVMELEEEIEGARARKASLRGRVTAVIPADKVEKIFKLRSVHSAVILLAEGVVSRKREGLDEVKRIIHSFCPHDIQPPGYTFAVEAQRIGEGHEYTSIDLAKVVGGSIQDCVRETRGYIPEVRLNSPHIVYYAEVNGDVFTFGILLTPEKSLHARRYRVYDHPASLKPTIAYGMLRVSGARDGELIIDPMCGGGTIAIEAALLFESSPIICMDKNESYLRGALMNVIAARVYNRVRLLVGDATRLSSILGEESVERILTNPPYGVRMGDVQKSRRLLQSFIPEAWRTLKKGGTLTLITPHAKTSKRVALSAGFMQRDELEVMHGDLRAFIQVFEKK